MSRIIRLTEQDLVRIVKQVIKEQGPYAPGMGPSSNSTTPLGVNPGMEKPNLQTIPQVTSKVGDMSKIELFQDPFLVKSIGSYTLGIKDSGMGRSHVSLKPTSNSKIKCLNSITYKISGGEEDPSKFTPSAGNGCWLPPLLFTNNIGKNLIKKFVG
jgi:hypothetical protein